VRCAFQKWQKVMKTQIPNTVSLGELILTVFDKAAQDNANAQRPVRKVN
jgi:hypothetical protein